MCHQTFEVSILSISVRVWSENLQNVNALAMTAPQRRNSGNLSKMRKFSIFEDYFSKIIFCVKRFPISSKVTKNTLLGDTDSIRNATESLRSRFYPFRSGCEPKIYNQRVSYGRPTRRNDGNLVKMWKFLIFGGLVFENYFLCEAFSHKLKSYEKHSTRWYT